MRQKKDLKSIFMVLAMVGVLAFVGLGVSLAVKQSNPAVSKESLLPQPPMIPASFSELAEKVRPGVVNIQVVQKIDNVNLGFGPFRGSPFGGNDPEFFDPWGRNPQRKYEQRGIGSGIIINPQGDILTNNHVVADADQIKVKLSNGREYKGKVLGRDPKTDLALIRIDGATDLHPLALGNSDNLKVGNWVVAVGSPFGLEQTVTAGIVSAKGRVIGSGPYDDFIQTDASINPGNSGGPLINLKGEVVGINTAIMAQGQGIGFAIPVNLAREVAVQLRGKGRVTRGWLGVTIQAVTPELADSFNLKDSKGALVAEVSPGGPAEKAGIQAGDILLEFDGKTISESTDLPRTVAETPIGKSVAVKMAREGKILDKRVTVGELQERMARAGRSSSHQSLGIMVQDLSPEISRELGLKKTSGVVIMEVEPGSPAAEAGLRPGDVIREVARKPVQNADDFVKKVEKAKEQGTVLLSVQRGETRLFAAVTLK
ncbi:MAG TPA: DegQ family serine endoprotease [Thermodesulfobacteriota bacterium]|nr:DegQ family serine endoprotease [Thermodesulfobacteriota bacterium]